MNQLSYLGGLHFLQVQVLQLLQGLAPDTLRQKAKNGASVAHDAAFQGAPELSNSGWLKDGDGEIASKNSFYWGWGWGWGWDSRMGRLFLLNDFVEC